MQSYFVVLDLAPVKGSPTPKYDLMYGNPDTATGYLEMSGKTIKSLLRMVPMDEPVYRVYLQRTDGKTGKKQIR